MITEANRTKFENLINVCKSIMANTTYLEEKDLPVLKDLLNAECFDTAFDSEVLRLYNHIRIQENSARLRREAIESIPLNETIG